MGRSTATRSESGPRALPWALIAIAAGLLSGLFAGAVGTGAVVQVFLLAAVLAVAAAVFARPEWGLWFMLLVLPLDTAGRLITSPVTVTVYHLALLLSLAAFGLRWLLEPDLGPRFSAVDAGVAVLLTAAVWSLPGSLATQATVVAIVRLAFLYLFFVLFSTLLRDEGMLDRCVKIVVFTSALAGLLALAQYRDPGLGIGNMHVQTGFGGTQTLRPAAFFDDPNYLAAFLSLGLIAAAGKLVRSRRALDALVWVVAAGACAGGLLVTFSRTGWVGALVGLVLLVLMTPPPRRRWFLLAMVTLAVLGVALAPGQFTSRLASIGDVKGDTSVGTRYLMFASTVDIIRDNWVFGTGLSAYDKAYPAYRRQGALMSILKPHQLPLAMWAEMGLPGLLAELAIVFAVIWTLKPKLGRRWNAYEAIGSAGLVALLVQSLFQYYLYFEYLWLFLALTVAATRITIETEEV